MKILALLLTSLLMITATNANAAPQLDPENTLNLQLKDGTVVIKLMPDIAPNHVARIKELVREGFYNGVVFHRVIDGFMAQTGDPTGTGTGGSSKPDLKAEFNKYNFGRGTVGAARSQSPNSANSQFFICYDGCGPLTGQYTVWGQVVSGMEFVDKIKRGEPPVNPDKVIKATIESDVAKAAPEATTTETKVE